MLETNIINGLIDIDIKYNKIELYETDCIINNGFADIIIHGCIYKKAGIFRNDISINLPSKTNRLELFRYIGKSCNIKITIDGTEYLIKANDDGHFNLIIPRSVSNVKEIELSLLDSKNEIYNTKINLIDEEGLTIISDIDDTIKFSNVLNKKELIENTFFKPFVPTSNMPVMYKKFYDLEKKYKHINFHYLSGSPWHLYKPLNDFIKMYYPSGSIYLKDLDIDDIGSVFKFLEANSYEYKVDRIENLLIKYPKRKFVLCGDNGEQDPDVYNYINKIYPDRILKIYIRMVKQEDIFMRMNDVSNNKLIIINE